MKWLKQEHDKLQCEHVNVKHELLEERQLKQQLTQELAKVREELVQRSAPGSSSCASEQQSQMSLPEKVIVFRSGDRYHVRQCDGMKSAKSEGRVLTLCAYCKSMSRTRSQIDP